MPNFLTMRSRHAFLLAMIPFALASAEASAQSEARADARMQGPPDGEDGASDGDQFIIGVGGLYGPKYLGADKSEFQPLPFVDIKWGRFFLNFQDGLGANLYESDAVTVGAGLNMGDGYDAKDVPVGVGKLSGGLTGRGFVKLRQAGFEATFGATKVISGGTKGFLADASLAYPIDVTDRLMLKPSIGTTWANKKHNDRYFGITAAQSAASGLPEYDAGSGLVDVEAKVLLVYRLTDRIGIMAQGGFKSLMGDAKDSPIVYHKTRPQGAFAVTYRF